MPSWEVCSLVSQMLSSCGNPKAYVFGYIMLPSEMPDSSEYNLNTRNSI